MVSRRFVELAATQCSSAAASEFGHPGLLMLEPGVEPLELERIDVDRRAVEVLPGPSIS